MNGKRLLDTNIIIGLLQNDEKIVNYIKSCPKVFITSTVLGELYFGAFKSSRTEKNLTAISQLLTYISVLNSNKSTARFYGQIKNQLKKLGKPIPENDIWIAASAMQYDLTLVSNDAHFSSIYGLAIDSPAKM